MTTYNNISRRRGETCRRERRIIKIIRYGNKDIKAALEILNGEPWHKLDIYNIVLMSVNTKNEDKEQMLYYAFQGGSYEKHKALTFVFEHSLPICKRQVFNAIQMQIKARS